MLFVVFVACAPCTPLCAVLFIVFDIIIMIIMFGTSEHISGSKMSRITACLPKFCGNVCVKVTCALS